MSRGRDWQWGNQDGGSGHVGRLSDITSWEHLTRAGAEVVWENRKSNFYRTGYRGLVSCTVEISIFYDLLLIIAWLVFVADITRALIGALISRNDLGTSTVLTGKSQPSALPNCQYSEISV